MRSRALLVEFNEITPALLQRFMAEGRLPNFKRLYERSTVYRTDAEDALLEPWVQWPTIHSGISHRVHGLQYLGEGRQMPYAGIATRLSNAGRRVGVFGSINSNYRGLNGYHMPDPWDEPGTVDPADVLPFFRFVSQHIKENSRHATATPGDGIAFLWFMLRNGLSVQTIAATALHVVRERLFPGQKWRRALILDLFQYDLFKRLNRRFDVEFATFFSNSTAHLQHYFWRNMEPQRFHVAPDGADASLKHAIRDAYVAMDRLLGRMAADHPDAQLFLCSGLSQRAWDETTKCTYRPHDFGRFLAFAGAPPQRVVPVMAERFRVACSSAREAYDVAACLDALTIDGAPLMGTDVRGNDVNAGCDLYAADDAIYDSVVRNRAGHSAEFRDLFYRVTQMNSGQHDPEGLLWIENDAHATVAEPLPLTAIAPLILERFGIVA